MSTTVFQKDYSIQYFWRGKIFVNNPIIYDYDTAYKI